MEATDLRQMTDVELAEELAERKQELFNLRFQNVTGQLDNPRMLVQLRRDIARVKTVQREREMAVAGTGAVDASAETTDA